MEIDLPYPFGLEFMRQNKAFMMFCPPDCLDADGRPVLEGRSVFYKLDKSAYQACRYSDSRANTDKPINVESLRALAQHHDEVVAFIREIARKLCDFNVTSNVAGDVEDLYALAYVCYKAPGFYFVNKVIGGHVEVPVACSIASRFFHGLVNLFAIMALDHAGRLARIRLTADEIYRYADKSGYLVGRNEACAASRATIIKYITVAQEALLLEGDETGAVDAVLPGGAAETLIRAAQIITSFEFYSLIYETVRCRSWRQINEIGASRADLNEPRPRFATTHCLVAKRLSLDGRPFEHILFKRASNLSRSLLIDVEPVARLIDLADECIGVDIRDAEKRGGIRREIKSEILKIIMGHRKFFDENIAGESYISVDLDIFFGRWPE
ncbi:hypothetical protein [Burkholderia cepacia]|uniref:hypothetical protein n=1 Tax=Burkholderia cepacia TaxID=292 RepID=UPI002FE2BFFE